MRRVTFFSGLIAAVMGLGLFKVKHQVQIQETKLKEVQRDIRHKQEAIHVLKAEWSYLNHPDRLQKLASTYLNLKPVQAQQMVTLAVIPFKTAEKDPPEKGTS